MKIFLFLLVILGVLGQNQVALATNDFKGSAVGVKAGLLYGCLGSAGLTFSLPLSKRLVLENSFMFSSIDHQSGLSSQNETDLDEIEKNIDEAELEDVSIRTARVTRQMLHSQLRLFPFGNSFNFGAGYAGAFLEANFHATSILTQQYIDHHYEVAYGAFTLNVGNLWTFNRLYISIDWIGTTKSTGYQIMKFENNSSEETTEGLDEYARRFEDSALFCPKYGGSTLLVFGFGLFL